MNASFNRWPACLLFVLTASRILHAEPMPLGNPGFEEGFVGWETRESVPVSDVTSEAARTGSNGLRMTDNDETEAAGVLSDPLPVQAGRVYRITCWARPDREGLAAISFCFLDGQGARIIKNPPAHGIPNAGGAWIEFSKELPAPEGAEALSILARTFSSATGTVDFDDFVLEEK